MMNENAHALKRNIQGTYVRHGTAGERTRETTTKTIDIVEDRIFEFLYRSNFCVSPSFTFLSFCKTVEIYTNRDPVIRR